jgi:hypothetical protein
MTVTLMMLQLWRMQNLGTSEGYIYAMTTGVLCSLYNFRNLQLLCMYVLHAEHRSLAQCHSEGG